jgi:hypothetical protein
VKNKLDLPPHLAKNYTARQWKAQKRKEFKALLAASDVFLMGCAFTPTRGYGFIRTQLKEMQKCLSVKEWGR